MPSTAQFQTLPWPVIDRIVHILTFSYDMDLCDTKSIVYRLLPLSHTCTQFRDAVFLKLKLSCSISIYGGKLEATYIPKFYGSPLSNSDFHFRSYVKHILYDFRFRDVINGLGIEKLQSIGFPLANTIIVVLSGIDEHCAKIDSAFCHIKQLAAHIKQQVPSASKVTLEIAFKTTYDSFDYTAVNYFASILFDNIEETELKLSVGHIPEPLDSHLFPHTLSSIAFSWHSNYHLAAQIIRNSASSLNSIALHCSHFKGLEKLFYDDNKLVTYPVTEIVRIAFVFKKFDNPLTHIDAAAVFPSLKKLLISCIYPFTNDIMFYGNYGCLNTLAVDLDYNFLHLFNSSSNLANKKLDSLQRLILFSKAQGFGDYDVDNSELYNMVKYTQSVEHLTVYNSTIPLKMIQLLDTKTKYFNMKKLCICNTEITLTDAIKMLQGMPALQVLRSKITGVGSEYEGLTVKQLVKHMLDKYPLLHKNFRGWVIYSDTPPLTTEFIKTIICLANVCPHFSKIMYRGLDNRQVRRLLLELVTSKIYLHCKPRLYAKLIPKYEFYWQIVHA